MQDKTISVLTDQEMKFTNDLQTIGFDRNTAKVMTYLCMVGPVTSRKLEMAADMRQPDVSRGLKLLKPFIKTSNEGRQILFSIEKPTEAINEYVKQMMDTRKSQDEATDRINKVINRRVSKKSTAKASKNSKGSKKVSNVDDDEVTLEV